MVRAQCTCILLQYSLYINRGMGEKFRELYGEVACIRSLLPSDTPVVALTATATAQVRSAIMKNLHMKNLKVVCKSCNRPNIRYSIVKLSSDIHVAFWWLVAKLRQQRASLERVVVFCRLIARCASL